MQLIVLTLQNSDKLNEVFNILEQVIVFVLLLNVDPLLSIVLVDELRYQCPQLLYLQF